MRHAADRPIALSLALVAFLTGCGLDVPGPNNDGNNPVGTGTPITTFTTPASAGCPAVIANSVLVDPTHDGGTWWFPQSASHPSGFNPDSAHQGRALAMYLRAQGYTVTELGRGATLPADSLLRYSVVIRAAYYYDANHPGYSAADLAAYVAYAACPRTIILLGEYLRDGRTDALADAFNIPLTGWENGPISTFTAHALTNGVTTLPFIAGSALVNENNSAIQVLGRLANGKAAMGILTSGAAAKVFFIGDVNGLQTVPQPFVDNLIAWGFP